MTEIDRRKFFVAPFRDDIERLWAVFEQLAEELPDQLNWDASDDNYMRLLIVSALIVTKAPQ